MYIVRSEITNKKWETEDLEDLLSNLEIENIHARRGNTTDKLIIYETDKGLIKNEITLELPTEEVIDDLFLKFSKANEETLTKLKNKDEIDDMTVEEREIFNKINSQNDDQNSNQARKKIIENLNENKRKEVAEEKRQQEELIVKEQQRLEEERRAEELRLKEQQRLEEERRAEELRLKEQQRLEEERRAEELRLKEQQRLEEERKAEELRLKEQQRLEEERRAEELRVKEQQRVKTHKEQYQAPVSYDTRNSQTTVYQATTILSVKDLTNNFKQQTLDEIEKIDRQIYVLEREKRKYQALIRAMEEI